MKKRTEDVEGAMDEAISEQLRTGEWRVYSRYERRQLENGDVCLYAPLQWVDESRSDPKRLEIYKRARPALEKDMPQNPELASLRAAQQAGILVRQNEPRRYRPLVEKPNLFKEFAELVQKGPITEDVMIRWVERHGVLGLNKIGGVARLGHPRGGPAENVLNFGERAWEANHVLRLYKAAKAPYGPDVETIKKLMLMPEVPDLLAQALGPRVTVGEDEEGRRTTFLRPNSLADPRVSEKLGIDVLGSVREALQEKMVNLRSPEELGKMALEYVRETMNIRLVEECSHRLYPQKDGTDRQGWRFRSLLGAMYFQMYSVMNFSGKSRVCKAPGCFESFSLEKPEPYKDSSGKWVFPRKPPSHKKLCGKAACAKAYERQQEAVRESGLSE